jgi:hypothetical protein
MSSAFVSGSKFALTAAFSFVSWRTLPLATSTARTWFVARMPSLK